MDTRKLRCFLAAADKGSFTRAAEELYFSVPTVTHHIKALEEELGVSLFERDRQGVRLTPAGKAFYPTAREVTDRLEAAVYRITSQRDFRLLRIGCTSHAEMVLLTSVFARLRPRCPEVRPVVVTLDYDRVLDLLEAGELDLVLGTSNMLLGREERFRFRPFCRTSAFAVVPSEHPLAGRESISFPELEGEVLVRMSRTYAPFNTGNPLTRLIEVHGLHSRDIHCDDDRFIMSLSRAGYGIAMLPGYCVPEYAGLIGLACVPIVESQELIHGAILRRRRLTKEEETLIALCGEKVRSGAVPWLRPLEG